MSAAAVLAVFAHPDDIEFVAAGTLLLLAQSGWQTHCLTLSGGDCGSLTEDRDQTRRIRTAEARAAAAILGASYHDGFADDLLIFYEEPLLRKLAAVIRRVRPRIVLTHAPADYMEDHVNTSRLTITAAFVRAMPNFVTDPLGQRLTALMISKGLADAAVPMSLLADHPNVQFNYFRGGLGSCAVEMH